MKLIGLRPCLAALGGASLLFAFGTAQQSLSAATTLGPNAAGDIVLPAASAPTRAGKWTVTTDSTAAGGASLRHPDGGAAKVTTALSAPANYFELSFQAEAGKPYRLWVHGRADRDYWGNDSVHVQFAGSVNASGSAIYQIGTTSAAAVNLEDCSGCGLSDWMWQDNGYGSDVLGPPIYFAQSGTQKIRVQTREDGIAIDEIVLSPSTYIKTQPVETLSGNSTASSTSTSSADVVLAAGKPVVRAGKWAVQSDATAIGGLLIRHPNAGAAKLTTALASPGNYFELTFNAVAGTPYRLWLHGRADNDYWANDSVFVQFSGSINASGSAVYRIGTTSAAEVNLEECNDCGISGWTWQDNGYGRDVLGPLVYFAATGTQTLRVQTREDGLAIDRIILSPSTFLNTAPAPTQAPTTTEPDPEPAPSTGAVRLRVLQWNLHHGVGTDGKYDIDRIATWIAKMQPDVVMLNEVEKFTGWGNEDQPARYEAMVEAKTGRNWYRMFSQEYGDWDANGKGHLILSTYPFDTTARHEISYERVIGATGVTVNGRHVSFLVTHLDPESQTRRLTQAKETVSWASTIADNRILTGDMNAWPDQSSIAELDKSYRDSWTDATSKGTANDFGLSPDGATKNGRIDYIFYSRTAGNLVVIDSRVYDTRSSTGVMPSDHRPVLTTFEVR